MTDRSFYPLTAPVSLILLAVLLLSALPAQAHNAVGGVYAIGDKIEGKVGFGNGTPAVTGTQVDVQNAEGVSLGSIQVEQDGAFRFTAKVLQDHYFLVDMGGGHIVKLRLPADELSLGHARDPESKVHSHIPHSHGTLTHTHDGDTHSHPVSETGHHDHAEEAHPDEPHAEDHDQTEDHDHAGGDEKTMPHSHEAGDEAEHTAELQNLIETAVARQIKPLREELAAYKEQAKFRDLLGGLGYLLGLAGLGAWLSQRRKNKAA